MKTRRHESHRDKSPRHEFRAAQVTSDAGVLGCCTLRLVIS